VTEDFKHYCIKKGYSLKTIKSKNSQLKRFSSFLISKQLSIEILTSENLLECLAWFRERNIQGAALRNCLQAIRLYLDYQVEKGVIAHNPALSVKIRSITPKPKHQPLSTQTMEAVYQWFITIEPSTEKERIVHKRDIVLLGLLLFQGLDSGDMERLTVQDINLQQGTVYVPSSRSNAARKLKLESIQILPIQEYLLTTRTKVLRCRQESDKLVPQSKINDILSRFTEQVKKQYPEIKGSRHIRSSVIMNWLRTNHIRQVQYMAGHRRVSSTEKYQKEDLHDLAQQLNKYHPMK
jgi:integrase/recombinase XerD